jgi:hypothetical protein
MNKLRATLLPLFLLAVSAAGQSQPAAKSDPFLQAVRKREAAVKVVDVTFKLKEIRPRGSPVPGSDMFPAKNKANTVLEADLVLESTNRIVIQGTQVRIEGSHPIWTVAVGKPMPEQLVSVSNKTTAKEFLPKGRGTYTGPTGVIYKNPMNFYVRLDYLMPIGTAYRGTNRLITVYPAQSFKPSGVRQSINGRDYQEYAAQVGKNARMNYAISPQLDYHIVRAVVTRNSRIIEQTDIVYDKDLVCEWVPVSWVLHYYAGTGKLQRRLEVQVVSTRFNEAIAEDQFDVVFPPGTIVTDQRQDKRYRVEADGSHRLLSGRGEDLGTEVSQENVSWYQRYVWWLFLVGASIVGLLAVLVVRKRCLRPIQRSAGQ